MSRYEIKYINKWIIVEIVTGSNWRCTEDLKHWRFLRPKMQSKEIKGHLDLSRSMAFFVWTPTAPLILQVNWTAKPYFPFAPCFPTPSYLFSFTVRLFYTQKDILYPDFSLHNSLPTFHSTPLSLYVSFLFIATLRAPRCLSLPTKLLPGHVAVSLAKDLLKYKQMS